MVQLLPYGFNLSSITNLAERQVVDILSRRLSPQWMLIPNFNFRLNNVDHEVDLVVLNADYGIGIVEVKGGRIGIKNGQWVHNGNPENPDDQARRNAYGLREILLEIIPTLPKVLSWGIALPDSTAIVGELPVDVERNQVILQPDLDEPDLALHRLFARRIQLLPTEVERIIEALCPTMSFTYDSNALDRMVREHITSVCEAQVGAIRELDINRRIYVEGRAGTGKTYLAKRWVWSGLTHEDSRILLTCYNDPLGQQFRDEFDDIEPRGSVTAGPFLRIMLELEGMPTPEFENTNDSEYWGEKVPAHIIDNWVKVTARFDRIVVDEAQDFSPAWIGLLESLLDPAGENKFFLLADERQTLIDRGFRAPGIDIGWVHARLVANVRNPRDIAIIARKYLDGASAPSSMPSANAIATRVITTDEEAVAEAIAAVQYERDRGFASEDILVVASSPALRDRLRQESGFGIAEDRALGVVSCEVAHRAKGLEYPVVIVVSGFDGFKVNALYVAITRASNRLWLVGGPQFLEDLGLGG